MLDFPNTPTPGQKYPAAPVAGVPTYVWDGEKWTSVAHAHDVDLTGFVPLAGGTMSGPLILNANPTDPLGATTKQQMDAKLNLAGGALTGPLTGTTATMSGLVKGSAVTGAVINVDAAAATFRQVRGLTAGTMRWSISMPDATAETGGNAGSNFAIDSYLDSGVNNQRVLLINRANGAATFIYGAQFTDYINIKASTTSSAEVLQFYNSAGTRIGWLGQFPANVGSMVFASDASGSNLTINTDATLGTPTATAYKAGGGPWAATSDARIKDVLGDYETGLAEVLGLHPVVYSYKGNDGDPAVAAANKRAGRNIIMGTAMEAGKPFIGLVAQEAEMVMPEMVKSKRGFIDGEQVEDFRTLDTGPLIYALVNAVKTLSARLEALEAA
jgi:hypothetical protein